MSLYEGAMTVDARRRRAKFNYPTLSGHHHYQQPNLLRPRNHTLPPSFVDSERERLADAPLDNFITNVRCLARD